VYGRKYKEVRKKLAEAMGDAARGIVFNDENMIVSEYMTRWLEDSAKGDLAPRTFHNYRLQIRKHISPTIGKLKLSKLTAAHVQSLYAAKLREGLKPSSVRYIHAVLHRGLEQAVRFSLIPYNPAARVDPRRRFDKRRSPRSTPSRLVFSSKPLRTISSMRCTSFPSPWGFAWGKRWG
jgi:integrase